MKYSILMDDSQRSRAYIQNLLIHNHLPQNVVIIKFKNFRINSIIPKKITLNNRIEYNVNQSVIKTLRKNRIDTILCRSEDVNSDEVVSIVKNLCEDTILFSVSGGQILRRKILSLDKIFIHVHPGYLPDFRGSTLFYYTLLLSNEFSCSIIEIDKGIDTGEILFRKINKDVYPSINIDKYLDPLYRTDTLIDYFDQIRTGKDLVKISNKSIEPYYIVHPVIKNFLIAKYNSNNKG